MPPIFGLFPPSRTLSQCQMLLTGPEMPWLCVGQRRRKPGLCTLENKMHLSCQANKSFVFAHLKNKIRDEPANLVTDASNNIIFQPNLAIDEINSRWDEIFSANLLKNEPLQALSAVWPHIHNICVPCDLEPINAHALYQTIQSRSPLAAPGLEGWRTKEAQALPASALKPIAAFFQLHEENDEKLPDSLVRAKQMILNKGASCDPLNIGLISLMPNFTLAYSGRYKQLASWQQKVMPASIVGAIPNRNMSSIQVDIRYSFNNRPSLG